MPSDSNGVYSLPNGYLAITGETIQASQHNPPLEDLGGAMTQRVMRSGATPMTGPLKLANGSASQPGMTFNSATGTGVYKTTNGLGVAVDGAQVAEFTADGMSKGGRFIGELIPYTGTTAQPLTVLPYGQTLNRADYPDLWTFAQAEIAAGNLSYNNGNGSTTFGILDMRGRVPAGKDDIGGTAANRLTQNGTGIQTTKLGAAGGLEIIFLTSAQIPAHTHPNTLNDPGHFHAVGVSLQNLPLGGAASTVGTFGSTNTTTNTTGITINNAANTGGGGAHLNIQPTMICNYLLFAGA
jgi:microcystin-dependent protein